MLAVLRPLPVLQIFEEAQGSGRGPRAHCTTRTGRHRPPAANGNKEGRPEVNGWSACTTDRAARHAHTHSEDIQGWLIAV
eukprot:scaffold4387_cov126-Isochrysis_galbana.AAC.4